MAVSFDGRARRLLVACAAPAAIFFAAFWLLPAARLLALPYAAGQGTRAYFVVLTQPRYLASLLQTTALSVAVTLLTLALGAAVGLYLGRRRFAGRGLLLSLLTVPLSFPGVVVGFFVILLGGRQGLLAQATAAAGMGRVTFAYGLAGLLLGYLYFSLPRAIASYTAAAEALDAPLEEAARLLGASPWAIVRDVWAPQLAPTTLACGAILFATCMGAFGTAFTLASQFEVLPITIYNEFTNYANFPLAASLSVALGLMTWAVLFVARRLSGAERLV
ncbi:ABC transporter permease subunit [Xylophilus rhododendri]|uniref:ABC transporter permease subunit n=1 Tax=Xylophilus rhododendri TaxID=2697032 RepID=A0A857JAE2_9BURK|nr:ABC transporter permease subunit [Xylophilus rhododendri]QHI99715.1 ABC transporter permease subunit [Xylophilus rhododendri]